MRMTRGERNVAWIEKTCHIPEGKFVGRQVVLRPFQRKFVHDIYDTKTRKAIISMGRKNAKTALGSFLLLLHLCGPEAKKNSQLVSSAQSRDQASLLYNYAWKCVTQSPLLLPYIHAKDSQKILECEELGTTYRALSADASRNLGLSPVFALHDELGQVKGPTSALYDAIETACGAHDDPLSIIISTQAPSDGDLLSIEIDDALNGYDPRNKIFFYTAPLDLDPFSEEAIKAANPAFGDFLNREEVLKQASEARRMPTKAASFKNYILNQRISAVSQAISPEIWKENGGNWDYFDEDLPVYGGLDLAETSDLAAFVLMQEQSDGSIFVKSTFWLPEDGLEDKGKEDREPYLVWAQSPEEWLKTTPGRALDYDFIAEHIFDEYQRLNIKKIGYDRWKWKNLRKSLLKAGFDDWLLDPDGDTKQKQRSVFSMVGQGFNSMGPAWILLENCLLTNSLRHGMHPVLTMCARNAVTVSDPAGNKKIAKNKSRGRVDGIVAMMIALFVRAEVESMQTDEQYIFAAGGDDD